MSSTLAGVVDVVIGVDTHKATHTAAAVDAKTGAELGQLEVNTDEEGYAALIAFADDHSGLRAWAIEGTGTYGAGLRRHLDERGEWVIELDRPERAARRNGAKSDHIDAYRAAREALSRRRLGQPRSAGTRSALSVRLVARRSAVDGAADAQRQLQCLVIAAPEPLRAKLRQHRGRQMVATAARLQISSSWDTETVETAQVLRALARRIQALNTEAAEHEKAILATVRSWRPDLLEERGVGPINAAVILCAWSHPGRFRNDGAFAKLAGVAPLEASTGQTKRHRLNRSGDRQLNRALHNIAISRLRWDPTTRSYAERRRSEGKTDREIRRCLKRYIARSIYRRLEHPPTTT